MKVVRVHSAVTTEGCIAGHSGLSDIERTSWGSLGDMIRVDHMQTGYMPHAARVIWAKCCHIISAISVECDRSTM